MKGGVEETVHDALGFFGFFSLFNAMYLRGSLESHCWVDLACFSGCELNLLRYKLGMRPTS